MANKKSKLTFLLLFVSCLFSTPSIWMKYTLLIFSWPKKIINPLHNTNNGLKTFLLVCFILISSTLVVISFEISIPLVYHWIHWEIGWYELIVDHLSFRKIEWKRLLCQLRVFRKVGSKNLCNIDSLELVQNQRKDTKTLLLSPSRLIQVNIISFRFFSLSPFYPI